MSGELSCAVARGSLADYTRPELIIPQLSEDDPPGIIKELSQRLREHGIIDDLLAFYHAAINHEFLGQTALRSGVAIPHVRSPQVRRLTLAVGRAGQPVVWGAKGSWPVTQVFLLAVPATDALDQLSLLSGIAGLVRQPELLARLGAAADAGEMFELLKEIRTHNGGT
jgi:mannitol/fructose-specific phosphotransferase system IIA component (Ntr-type)